MSKLISIRDDLYEKLSSEEWSFSQMIDQLFAMNKTLIEEQKQLQETTITQEGRISKTLAGKTILYKIKD